MSLLGTRPQDAPIPAAPEAPFPIVETAEVVLGFGRGLSELGIPTANLPIEQLPQLQRLARPGVYFGWCRVAANQLPSSVCGGARPDGTAVEYSYGRELREGVDTEVLPMVALVGWNPFFKNELLAVELHVMHPFATNFYGAKVTFCVLGYIRPELDYTTVEALVADINEDIAIAQRALALPGYAALRLLVAPSAARSLA